MLTACALHYALKPHYLKNGLQDGFTVYGRDEVEAEIEIQGRGWVLLAAVIDMLILTTLITAFILPDASCWWSESLPAFFSATLPSAISPVGYGALVVSIVLAPLIVILVIKLQLKQEELAKKSSSYDNL